MNRSTSVAAWILTALLIGCSSNDASNATTGTTKTDGAAKTSADKIGAPSGETKPAGTEGALSQSIPDETPKKDATAAPGTGTTGTGGTVPPIKSVVSQTGEASTPEVGDLVARLRRDKERQDTELAATQPPVPSPEEMEQELNAMSRNFLEKLASGDPEAAKPCFLSDEDVTRLFSPAFSRLFASTRGNLNVVEWEKFQLSTAGGQETSYVGCESVRPAVANPRERGLYQEAVLFIDTIAVDYKIGDDPRKLKLKHLVKLDGEWKFLQFQLSK